MQLGQAQITEAVLSLSSGISGLNATCNIQSRIISVEVKVMKMCDISKPEKGIGKETERQDPPPRRTENINLASRTIVQVNAPIDTCYEDLDLGCLHINPRREDNLCPPPYLCHFDLHGCAVTALLFF